jgi:1-acyl-sn-glycerol-3-phosphate acyltransferase
MEFARIAWRFPLCIMVLIAGLLIQLAVFPGASVARKHYWIARWSRWILRSAGVTVIEHAAPGQALRMLTGPRLLVANHMSWLDIMVINSLAPASFIAKAEIRAWPVLGWLVATSGTLFIDRGKRAAIRNIVTSIEHQLDQHQAVALFAEGTTNDMTYLLPFHSNLMQPAITKQATVVPLGLRYIESQSGSIATAVEFVGDTTIVQSVLRVLSARAISAQLHVLPTIQAHTVASRQILAKQLQDQISLALNLPVKNQDRPSTDA